jgi:kynurenine formamidase
VTRIAALPLLLGLIATEASTQPSRSRSPEELLARAKDPLLRETAAQVMGLRGSLAALPLLQRALRSDDDRWVRGRCAEALGMLGSPAAIPSLRAALAREKDQRVRRMIARAQIRLGQTAGVRELMWQLRSGTNYAKAEAMEMLVAATGQPLGQDVEGWWTYLDARGNMATALRPRGSPAVLELRGLPRSAGGARHDPQLHGRRGSWQQLPAVVLDLAPTTGLISRGAIERHEKQHGALPDGCLLLLRTAYRDAKPPPPAAAKVSPPRDRAKPAPPVPSSTPTLDVEAVRYLLQRAPKLLGVGMDTPTLDGEGTARPARELLLQRGRLVLEAIDDLDRLPASGVRVVIVPLANGNAARVLAIRL